MADRIFQRLGEVARVRSGFAFKSSDMTNVGVPIIKIKNITPPFVDTADCEKVPEAVVTDLPDSDRYLLQEGDILIAMTGATTGKVGRFPKIETRYYLNQRVGKVYLIHPDRAEYRYLYFVLSQPAFVQRMFGLADGSAQGNISGSQIENLKIPLPPLREQRAIACILGALDDKIELNRRMNETLEGIARTVFKSWFVDGTREGLPEGWRESSIDAEFNLTMGQSPPGDTYNESGDGIPFFQGRADFGFRYPNRRVYCSSPTRFAHAGDTLVSVRAPVGSVNLAAERCSIGRGLAAVRHKTGSRSFTYYLMRSLKPVFARFEAEGTVFGSITKSDFHKIRVPAPPASRVRSFEEFAFPIGQRIENNEIQSRTLAALRDALLPKLISGELRVPDAERIVGRCK